MSRIGRFPVALAVTVALSAAAPTSAEISSHRDGNRTRTMIVDLVTSITDGADPIPELTWQVYRTLAATDLLNPTGAVRPDGRPHLAWLPGSRFPIVAWAFNNGNEHDIAVAEWTGNAWGATSFLTATAQNEQDPRIFVEGGGTRHVVWWVDSAEPHIRLASVAPDGTDIGLPRRVSPVNEIGRRPTVAAFQGQLFIAYEVETSDGDPAGSREIVVRRQLPEGTFVLEHTLLAEGASPFRPMLHAERDRLWLDWRHSAESYGCVALEDSGWSPIELHALEELSWLGIESVQRDIRRRVLAGPVSIDPTVPAND